MKRVRMFLAASAGACVVAALAQETLSTKPTPTNETEACRSKGTSLYSGAAHRQLLDFLAYDRGPAGMNIHEMKSKVQRLIDDFPYIEAKALLKACIPQLKQGLFNPGRGVLDAQLRRSRIIIYDEIDKLQFSRVVVLLTGLP